MRFLGLDCGASKTRSVIVDGKGNVLGFSYGGPANVSSTKVHSVKKEILKATLKVMKETGTRHVNAACVSAAGVGVDKWKKVYSEPLVNIADKIIVLEDYKVAHVASFMFKNGIIVISGTGSVAYGTYGDAEVRIGGWGHILGDEGSAFQVGRDGLVAALKSFEGRGRRTILEKLIFKKLRLSDPRNVTVKVYSSKNIKRFIANLAPTVIKAYRLGDEVARDIVEASVRDIVSMIKAVWQHLGGISGFKVALTGGFYEGAKSILKPLIKRELRRAFGFDLEIHEPLMRLECASALIAMKNSGIYITEEIMSNMIAQCKP